MTPDENTKKTLGVTYKFDGAFFLHDAAFGLLGLLIMKRAVFVSVATS